MKDIKIKYNDTFGTIHSRDYYKGKSFHFAGEWVPGAHYFSDDYNVDFVTKDNCLLACARSHFSTLDKEPKDFIYDDNGSAIGIASRYWDFVLCGLKGVSPRIKVEDGSWWISYNNGKTWEKLTGLSNYVPKSGSTEMSNDAEFVFPSDNWDEQNDTGYTTKISQQGVHCYDPDDGSELHMDGTDMAFINGSYSGQHTSYGNGAIGYHPSSSSNYTYSFPSKSGTFAMTSDVNNYVPKSGGWLNNDASLYVGSGLDNYEQSQEGTYTKITSSAIELYDFDDAPQDPWYVKMNSTYPGVAVYDPVNGRTQYSSYGITRIKNNNSYNLALPLKSGTFALTSDIPDPRTLPYTITIVGQNGDYNVAYDFNIQDIDEWIRNGSTVFLIVKQDESNPTNEYLRGTFPLVEIDYDNLILKFCAGKYNISLEYIVDGNGDVNKSNVTVYISEPFQNKISDLSTIRSGSALGATSLQPGDVPTYYTGTTDPSSSLGSNGDIYLKLSS